MFARFRDLDAYTFVARVLGLCFKRFRTLSVVVVHARTCLFCKMSEREVQFWGYFWDISGICLGYVGDMLGICLGCVFLYFWDFFGICFGLVLDIVLIFLVYFEDIFWISLGYV